MIVVSFQLAMLQACGTKDRICDAPSDAPSDAQPSFV